MILCGLDVGPRMLLTDSQQLELSHEDGDLREVVLGPALLCCRTAKR